MANDRCDAGDACCTPPPLKLHTPKAAVKCGNGDACCASAIDPSVSHYKRVLWAVLAVNAAMFVIEIGAGLMAGSASLQADALDFLGDAAKAAAGVFRTSAGWPDLIVATIMAALGLQGAAVVVRRATGELARSSSSSSVRFGFGKNRAWAGRDRAPRLSAVAGMSDGSMPRNRAPWLAPGRSCATTGGEAAMGEALVMQLSMPNLIRDAHSGARVHGRHVP